MVSDRARRVLRPGALMMIFIVGGAYVSGQEITQFAARYGAAGAVSVVCIAVGFAVLTSFAFEFARWKETRGYGDYVAALLGERGVAVFDIVFVLTALYLVGVVTSFAADAAHTITGLYTTIHLPPVGYGFHLGHVILGTAVVVLLTLSAASSSGADGPELLERFDEVGSVLVVGVFLLLTVVVFSHPERIDNATRAFTGETTSYCATVEGCRQSLSRVVLDGLVYVGIHIPVYPLIVGSLYDETTQRVRLRSRPESVLAGIAAGVLMTTPFALTYVVQMGFYPNPDVLGVNVPWFPVLEQTTNLSGVAVYLLVSAWGFLATVSQLTKTVVGRIENTVEWAADATLGRDDDSVVGFGRRTVIRTAVVVVGVVLSRYELPELIRRGYAPLAVLFLIVFVVPLLVRFLSPHVDRVLPST